MRGRSESASAGHGGHRTHTPLERRIVGRVKPTRFDCVQRKRGELLAPVAQRIRQHPKIVAGMGAEHRRVVAINGDKQARIHRAADAGMDAVTAARVPSDVRADPRAGERGALFDNTAR